jgi:nickel transport protein
MKRLTLILILALHLVSISPLTALAHGVEFKYEANLSYLITGSFVDGSPLSEAQVSIYAPDDPKNPWVTGTSDEQGQYGIS